MTRVLCNVYVEGKKRPACYFDKISDYEFLI